jgi:hypothetical protein
VGVFGPKMLTKVLFQCKNCGGNVVDCRKDGRFYEHRGIWILLPEHFTIPRCSKCNEEWFTDKLIKDLELVLEQEYKVHEALIQSIIEFHLHKAEK